MESIFTLIIFSFHGRKNIWPSNLKLLQPNVKGLRGFGKMILSLYIYNIIYNNNENNNNNNENTDDIRFRYCYLT